MYLITGIAGFIGSHIAEELIKTEFNKKTKIIGIDNFYSGKRENIKMLQEFSQANKNIDFIFYEVDLRDQKSLEKIFKTHKIEYIFHLGAIASVQKSIIDSKFTNSVNISGSLNILNLAKDFQVKKVVFSSSASVYGDEPTLPKNEESPIKPISPYGLEKITIENYLKLYSEMFNLESVVLRYFNVFGERQDPKSEYSGVISIFENRLKNNQDIFIYGDGEQYRDFIYVKDVVKINLKALKTDNKFDIFCVGSGTKTTINNLYLDIKNRYKSNGKAIYKSPRQGDIRESIADITKIKREFKYV
jgi:UDP-glucose 4-epimerase